MIASVFFGLIKVSDKEMGGEERSGDGEKRGEEVVDAGSLFVLKSKGTFYYEIYET